MTRITRRVWFDILDPILIGVLLVAGGFDLARGRWWQAAVSIGVGCWLWHGFRADRARRARKAELAYYGEECPR